VSPIKAKSVLGCSPVLAASQNLNTIKDLLHSRASKCQENMRDYNFRWNITSVKGAIHTWC